MSNRRNRRARIFRNRDTVTIPDGMTLDDLISSLNAAAHQFGWASLEHRIVMASTIACFTNGGEATGAEVNETFRQITELIQRAVADGIAAGDPDTFDAHKARIKQLAMEML